MSKGIFTDKNHEPTEEEIFDAISSATPLWDSLISFIETNYKIKGEFKFYGKNFGWALRYRKSGRVLISIYPGKDEFVVQIILNGEEVEKALQLDITPETRKIIVENPPIREGKWIYLKITPDTSLADIKNLILVRSPIKVVNNPI
jgi:hypothetical protein